VTTLEKLNDVLREVFEDPDLRVTPSTTASDVDGWDSLSHVNVILAVEMHFGISFLPKDLLTFRCVGDLVRSIDAKTVAR